MKAFAPEVIDALPAAARTVALELALLFALVSVETTEQGMTGLVSGWLAAHHAPTLVADEYKLVASPKHLLVIP